MNNPTVRLHFEDGSHYDCYASSWFFVSAVGPICNYRKSGVYRSITLMHEGDSIALPDDAGLPTVRVLARREAIAQPTTEQPKGVGR